MTDPILPPRDEIAAEELALAHIRIALRRAVRAARAACDEAAAREADPDPDQRALAETHGPGLLALLDGATREAVFQAAPPLRALVAGAAAPFDPAHFEFAAVQSNKITDLKAQRYVQKLKTNTQNERATAAALMSEAGAFAAAQLLAPPTIAPAQQVETAPPAPPAEEVVEQADAHLIAEVFALQPLAASHAEPLAKPQAAEEEPPALEPAPQPLAESEPPAPTEEPRAEEAHQTGSAAVPTYACTLDDVRAAAARIAGFAHRTPVLTCDTLDRLAGRKLYFKCENLQKIGAFKYRGATNAVRKLSDAEAARGVVTHSSGNHAQALALAARVRGVPAYIVMPTTAPAVKRAAVEGYGGRVTLCEPNLAAREAAAARLVAETGATLIPPFDHADVIAGQGTAALELLDEVPHLDALITPVGGGGLLAGCAIAGRGVKPGLRVFGAEPLGADDAARSKAAGAWQPQTAPNTIADGLLTSTGQLTWPVIRDLVEAVFTVTDDEIRAAMRLVWERMKLIVEPSGAVGAAVALGAAFRVLPGAGAVGIVFSGGNVSLDKLYW
jgi:threonine dehydratase/serine racemase